MGYEKPAPFGLAIDEDVCSKCALCVYACPFEAVKIFKEEGGEQKRVKVEEEKCRLCGLCYSTCPIDAIRICYYDVEELLEAAKRACAEARADTLILACKGSNPDDGAALRRAGVDAPVIRLPCLGRVPLEFYARLMLEGGVRRILALPCDEEFCRFKEGGRVSLLKLSLLKDFAWSVGFDGEALEIRKGEVKAKVIESKCIGCANCVHYCPYEAVKLRSPGIAQIDESKCKGCGICLAFCPAFAIELEGYEHRRLSEYVAKLGEKAKGMPRPSVLVFYCQWAFVPPADGLPPNVELVELPCAGRADPALILQAMGAGFDGVLVLACKRDLCNFEEKGSQRAEEQIARLKAMLEPLGMADRVDIAFTSMKYPEEGSQMINGFLDKLKGAGR